MTGRRRRAVLAASGDNRGPPSAARRRDRLADTIPAFGDLQPLLRAVGSERASVDLLAGVLAVLPMAIALYDASDDDFRVIYLNQLARDLAGLGDEYVVGTPFLELYQNPEAVGVVDAFRAARASGVTQSRHRYPGAAGRVWTFDSFVIQGDDGRTFLLAAGHRETREDSRLNLETLIQSTEATSLPASPRDLAARATEQGVRIVDGVECMVTLIDAATPETLEIVAGTGPWARSLIGRRMPAAGTFSGQAIARRASVETTNARANSTAWMHLEEGGMDTLRVVPLAADKPFSDGRRALGVIGFYRGGHTRFTSAERQLMDQFGRWITMSLHRAELLEEAQATAWRLQVGVDIAIDLAASLDSRTVIDRLLRTVLEALEADRVGIVRVEGESAVVEGSLDLDPAYPPFAVGTRFALFSTAFRRVLRDRRAMVEVIDPSEFPRDLRATAAAIRHSLTVPMVQGGEAFAALTVSRRSEKAFLERDTAMLQQLATVAGLALRNAGLYEEVEQSRDRARAIARSLRLGVEVAVDLSSQLDPDEVVRRLLRRVTAAVGADRGTLNLIDGDSVVVMDSHALAGDPAEPGSRWGAPPGTLVGEAIRTQLPVQVSAGDPAYDRSEKLSTFRHGLAVPLAVQGQVLYVLRLSRVSGTAFTEEEIATLQQVGNVAVLSLRNAQLYRAKTEFMNLAAHELRTPLAVLNGYVSMLQDGTFGPPSEEWRRPVGVLAGKTRELGQLVENLLVGARLEAGQLTGSRIRVDLGKLARDAIERARPRVDLLRGDVHEDQPDAAVLVEGDAEQLGCILDNLINNAITYSDGTPELTITVRRGEQAEVIVTDSGRGIPPALHERVFEQFYRVEEPGTGNPSGTGLGLYISRQLAARHGGTLSIVASEAGKGSSFALCLPLP